MFGVVCPAPPGGELFVLNHVSDGGLRGLLVSALRGAARKNILISTAAASLPGDRSLSTNCVISARLLYWSTLNVIWHQSAPETCTHAVSLLLHLARLNGETDLREADATFLCEFFIAELFRNAEESCAREPDYVFRNTVTSVDPLILAGGARRHPNVVLQWGQYWRLASLYSRAMSYFWDFALKERTVRSQPLSVFSSLLRGRGGGQGTSPLAQRCFCAAAHRSAKRGGPYRSLHKDQLARRRRWARRHYQQRSVVRAACDVTGGPTAMAARITHASTANVRSQGFLSQISEVATRKRADVVAVLPPRAYGIQACIEIHWLQEVARTWGRSSDYDFH